jgi:PAS domain S-box-containing protein
VFSVNGAANGSGTVIKEHGFSGLQVAGALSAFVLVCVFVMEQLAEVRKDFGHLYLVILLGVILSSWALYEVSRCLLSTRVRGVRTLLILSGVQLIVFLMASFVFAFDPSAAEAGSGKDLAAIGSWLSHLEFLWPLLELGVFLLCVVQITQIFSSEQKARAIRIEFQMLSSLYALSMARDNETGKHILRTQEYVRVLAMRLRGMGVYADQLNDQMIDTMHRAAPLHDIGKVGIPDQILLKPGKLDPDEWALMKTHTVIGETVLSAAESQARSNDEVVACAAAMAGGHHEQWNGSGYPRGLKEEQIPLAARIMALADVYDALTNSRVYKRAWTHDEAVKEIFSGKGTRFDPMIVEAFACEEQAFRGIARRLRDNPEDARAASDAVFPTIDSPELKRTDERFEMLFRNSPLGMAIMDRNTGEFVLTNDSLLELTGYGRNELMALTAGDIVPVKYLPQEATQLDELDSFGRFSPRTSEYIRKDGSHIPVRISGFRLVDDVDRKLVLTMVEKMPAAESVMV